MGSSLGQLIRRHRQAAKMTLRELGKKSGIHYAVLCDIENGKRPQDLPLAKLRKICKVFKKKPDDFLVGVKLVNEEKAVSNFIQKFETVK